MIAKIVSRLKKLKTDASLSGLITGLIIVLVGISSSAVIVFQAAHALGLSPLQASSWLGSLCFGMGFLTMGLSIYYQAPIMIAWSTAGAAILVLGLKDVALSEAIGAFLSSAGLILFCGVSGLFQKLINRIPMALASALLAGVLLHFSMESFVAVKTAPSIVGAMILTYLLARQYFPRWTMMIVVVVGITVAGFQGSLQLSEVHLLLAQFSFVQPTFSWTSFLSLAVPLFIVTMAAQNLTGISALRVHGYDVPVSPLISWTGFLNLLTAPFGGYAVNLAAVTAAIAMGEESHPDPRRRYFSAFVSGAIYVVVGIFAGTLTSLFAAFPPEMIMAIAGLALLSTISNCLHAALTKEDEKEAAFITFVVAASGLSLFQIGSAFWAVIFGLISQFILKPMRADAAKNQ